MQGAFYSWKPHGPRKSESGEWKAPTKMLKGPTTLREFLEYGGKGMIPWLAQETGLSERCIRNAYSDKSINHSTARYISEATGGRVPLEQMSKR